MTATFSWDTDPSNVVYEITYQDVTNSGSIISVPSVNYPTNSVVISGLAYSTEYLFCVRAVCDNDGGAINGASGWSCLQHITPDPPPKFMLGARLYSPIGTSFAGDSIQLSNSGGVTYAVGSAANNYEQVQLDVSLFADNVIKTQVTYQGAKCEAIMIWKNGQIIGGNLFTGTTGTQTFSFNMNAQVYPSVITDGDVIDIVFIINNDQTTTGNPYVHPSYIRQCSNVPQLDI